MKFLLLLFYYPFIFSQPLEKICKLNKKLHEISGLVFLNDSTLVAHNDSDNEAELYFLNLNGKIFHTVNILGVTNTDWEDITTDHKEYLYIGDIGNNSNARKDLAIYKIKIDSLFLKSSNNIFEKIEFYYEDQLSFPPTKKDLHFDAEALTFYNDSLYIFTKSRTIPFDGISFIYKIPCTAGKHKAKKIATLNLKSRKMIFDAVTAVEASDSLFYILTYSGIEIFKMEEKNFVKQKRISFFNLTQKEALAIRKNIIYIADEKTRKKNRARLYKIKLKC